MNVSPDFPDGQEDAPVSAEPERWGSGSWVGIQEHMPSEFWCFLQTRPLGMGTVSGTECREMPEKGKSLQSTTSDSPGDTSDIVQEREVQPGCFPALSLSPDTVP